MSLFETKSLDHFVYEEAADPREHLSNHTPFLKKNVSYVVDQQAGNGSYTSGEVIVDSQSIAASGNMIDWRNGYLAVPINVRWDVVFGTNPVSFSGSGGGAAKFALALKNCSLLDSLKVEANGKTIVTATQGLASLINFKLLSTMTPSSLLKDSAGIGFYPDSQGVAADGGADSYNAANDPLAQTIFGDDVYQYNRGLVERQGNFLPSYNSGFMSTDNHKEEASTVDLGSGTLTATTSTQNPSDIHCIAVIRLRDVHDYFDKHVLSRGVSYRFTLKFNQAISTIVQSIPTGGAFGSPTSAITSITTKQTSGSVQPAMFCGGAATVLTRMVFNTGGIATSTITSAIDTTADARFSGVRLYVPSWELDPAAQEKLLAQPIVKKSFMDFMSQTTQTYAAPGSAINVQVSTSATNPRALIVIPRWSQTSTGNGGQGFYSETSPFSTVPGTTDALLSLTNLQVKMGSQYVLPDRMFYSFAQFQDHVSSIFAQNGAQTTNTSGLISKKSFEVNNRYYAFDLSRYPDAMSNLPQMVSLECKNNTQVPIELMCILLYSRDAEFNLAAGSLTVMA